MLYTLVIPLFLLNNSRPLHYMTHCNDVIITVNMYHLSTDVSNCQFSTDKPLFDMPIQQMQFQTQEVLDRMKCVALALYLSM